MFDTGPWATGRTPLHATAKYYGVVAGRHGDTMDALLRAGSKPAARDRTGRTPLHAAAKRGVIAGAGDTMDALLRAGSKPAARDTEGRALHQSSTLSAQLKPRRVPVTPCNHSQASSLEGAQVKQLKGGTLALRGPDRGPDTPARGGQVGRHGSDPAPGRALSH